MILIVRRDIPRLAKHPPALSPTNPKPNSPYIQLRSFKFDRSIWKGYEHRMTKGERAGGLGKPGQGGEDRTWEFCLKE
jgi:25S rRNA (uracil2634-N3)-methyltransferase